MVNQMMSAQTLHIPKKGPVPHWLQGDKLEALGIFHWEGGLCKPGIMCQNGYFIVTMRCEVNACFCSPRDLDQALSV
jgi:hypothetical protein